MGGDLSAIRWILEVKPADPSNVHLIRLLRSRLRRAQGAKCGYHGQFRSYLLVDTELDRLRISAGLGMNSCQWSEPAMSVFFCPLFRTFFRNESRAVSLVVWGVWM